MTQLFSSLGWQVQRAGSYGLGRDFVGWIDRIRAVRPGTAADSSAWDTSRLVLRPEKLLNRALDRFDAGVVLWATLRRR